MSAVCIYPLLKCVESGLVGTGPQRANGSTLVVETGEKSCGSSFLVDEERESTEGVKAGQDRFPVNLAN